MNNRIIQLLKDVIKSEPAPYIENEAKRILKELKKEQYP